MAGKVLLDLIFYHLLCVVKCRFMYYLVLWSAIGRQFVLEIQKIKTATLSNSMNLNTMMHG